MRLGWSVLLVFLAEGVLAFVQRPASASRLVVEVYSPGEAPLEMTFALGGLDEHLARLQGLGFRFDEAQGD